ncbi:MAG: hypothetical protein ACJ8HJ_06945, partial [Massilia sp.]
MFSFFKKKKPEAETPAAVEPAVQAPVADAQPEAPGVATPAEQPGFLRRLFGGGDEAPAAPEEVAPGTSTAYEGQLFPETAERPVSEAEARRSWMSR